MYFYFFSFYLILNIFLPLPSVEINLPDNIAEPLTTPSPTLSCRSEPIPSTAKSPINRFFRFHRGDPTPSMEFAVPQAPAPISKVHQLQRSRATSELVAANNLHNLQNQQSFANGGQANKLTKMTKKQTKVAQDKIEQISIHLHGMYNKYTTSSGQ
jgi:hypothetical protein